MICKEIERSDIYVVEFFNHRTQQHKTELCVIVQPALAEHFPKRLSCPLKPYRSGELHATHVPVMLDGQMYVVKCEFIEGERVENLKTYVRSLTNEELKSVNKALIASLGLVPEAEYEFFD